MLGLNFAPRSVQVEIYYPDYRGVDIMERANFHDFWYVKGSHFSTMLTCASANVISQQFKDLYDQNGWTGLTFSEPIVIHDLKPGLLLPTNYYNVQVVGRCEKVVAHTIVKGNSVDFKSGWEVVNDRGFSFFHSSKLGALICSHEVGITFKKAKVTNLYIDVFSEYKRYPLPYEDPNQMEF
jgi:hypothetical protein